MKALAALLVLAALALAGCGVGAGDERLGGVDLRVTRDFGTKKVATIHEPTVREDETVMRFLSSRLDVKTRYGGGFVDSIDGLAGGGAGGRRDWFFFVNGREASVGAAEYELSPGDVVQWDYRDWRAAPRVPAIVGAFPEPFVRGFEGKRRGVRVECEKPGETACEEVRSRLDAVGAKPTGGKIGSTAGPGILRVVVARWEVVRDLRTPSLVGAGPDRSGVYARIDGDGRIAMLDARGDVARTAPAGSGLIAATSRGEAEEMPTWVITGADDAGVRAAAAALDKEALRDAYAVAVLPDGAVPLPVTR